MLRMSDAWTVETLLVGKSYSSTCTLLMNGAHRVIVDSGLSIDEGALEEALRGHQLAPDDIDIVVNTHLHLDHCGNNVVFTQAAIFLSRREWQWTMAFYAALFDSPTPERAVEEFYPELRSYEFAPRTVRNAVRLARLFWKQERLGAQDRFRWIESADLPAGLEVVPSPGHTPFHFSLRVAAPTPVLVAGDAVLAERPDANVRTMIPYSREQFLATRTALLRQAATIVPGHGPAFWNRAGEPQPTLGTE
jgi:glyoxylase-like metal-dependent hydrolase (beta-lactamase superfamily II)